MSVGQRMTFKATKNSNFLKYKKYMEEITPILIEAENKVDEIKNSKEWKLAYSYFHTMYNRGQLVKRPIKNNGYKIELSNCYVSLGDIEDLLTKEQLEEIKKRL